MATLKIRGKRPGMVPRRRVTARSTTPPAPATGSAGGGTPYFGGFNASGVAVTSQTALSLAAYWCAIKVISDDVGVTPCLVYRRTPAGGKLPDYGHPACDLVRWEANEDVHAASFMRTLVFHALNYANGYANIRRDPVTGEAVALDLLDPRNVEMKRTDDPFRRLYYALEGRNILPEDMIHIKGLTFDGISGLSIPHHGRETVGLGLAQDIYSSSIYANGGQIPGFLVSEMPMDETKKQEFREEYEHVHAGADRANTLGLLQGGGWSWISTGITPEAAAIVEARQWTVTDVCRLFNIAPTKVHDWSHANYASLEQANIAHLNNTLMPWFRELEMELNRKLLRRDERAGWEIGFDTTAILRGDSASRIAYYRAMEDLGVLSPNRICIAEGFEPWDIPAADSPYLPMNNLTPLASLLASPPAAPPAAASVDPAAAVDRALDDWVVGDGYRYPAPRTEERP